MTSQPLSAPSTLSFHNVFRGCHCPELLRFNIFFLKKSQVGGMSRVLKAQHLWLLRGYTTLLVTITNRPEMVPAELSEAAPRMILPCSGIGQLASMQWMASYCCWKTKMGTHPFWMHKAGHASSPDAQCWAHIHVACMCCSPWLSARGWDAMGMWPRWPPWQQRSWQQTVGHITGHEVFCSAVDFSTGEQDWALLGCWEEKHCWGVGVWIRADWDEGQGEKFWKCVLENVPWLCQRLACWASERAGDACSRRRGLSQTSSSLLQSRQAPQALWQAPCWWGLVLPKAFLGAEIFCMIRKA